MERHEAVLSQVVEFFTGSRGGTSSSPVHGAWEWCSAIKSSVALLNLDPAGNDKASNHTAFLYLHYTLQSPIFKNNVSTYESKSQ